MPKMLEYLVWLHQVILPRCASSKDKLDKLFERSDRQTLSNSRITTRETATRCLGILSSLSRLVAFYTRTERYHQVVGYRLYFKMERPTTFRGNNGIGSQLTLR